jgi:hypothetical protein
MSRRIGLPTLWERAREPLLFAVVGVVLFVLLSTFLVALNFGGRPIGLQVQFWCRYFGMFVTIISASLLFIRRDRAVAFSVLGGLILAAVWFWGIPVYAALTGTNLVMVIPPESQ